MAITHVGSHTPTLTNNTDHFHVSVTTDVLKNDLLILSCTNRDSTADPSTPTDNETSGNAWQKIHGRNNGTSGASVWWKRIVANNTATITVDSLGYTGSCAGGLSIYRGCSIGLAPYENVTGETNISGNEVNAGITPSRNGALVCLSVFNATNDIAIDTESTTSPGTLDERSEHLNTGGSDCSVTHASAIQTTAETTGNFTWAQTDAASQSIAFDILPAVDNVTAYGGTNPYAGSTVILTAARKMTANSGAFAYSGSAVDINRSYRLTIDTGTYGYAGTATSLLAGRKMTANSAAYAYAGTATTLLADRKVTANSGAYGYVGTATSVLAGRKMTPDSGDYGYVGNDVTLTYESAGYPDLVPETGTYAYNVTDIGLYRGYPLGIEAGAYGYVGNSLALVYGRSVVIETGTLGYTGSAIALLAARLLGIETGTYGYAGADVGLSTGGASITIETGAYPMTGTDVDLFYGRYLALESGAYGYAGGDMIRRVNSLVPTTPPSIVINIGTGRLLKRISDRVYQEVA